MSSPYPGNPPPQQPQGGSPYGGGPTPNGSQWGSPPPGTGGTPPPPGGPGGPPYGPGGPQPPAGGQPPAQKKPWPWILGICGCLVLLLVVVGGGGLALFAFSGGDDDPPESPTAGQTEEVTTDDPTEETTTEEPTDEPTTEEPTEEPTTEEPTSDAGLPGVSGFESTPVQDPTDDDVEMAKQTMLAYLMALSDNDPAAACAWQLDPLTGNGIDHSSFLVDSCVESTQEAIDEQELEGRASHLTVADFEAELDADNRVVLVHNIHADDPSPAQIAKGANGDMYLASL